MDTKSIIAVLVLSIFVCGLFVSAGYDKFVKPDNTATKDSITADKSPIMVGPVVAKGMITFRNSGGTTKGIMLK